MGWLIRRQGIMLNRKRDGRVVTFSLCLLLAALPLWASTAQILTGTVASAPPLPQSVTIAGSLQNELGCPGDWQPDCAATRLQFDPDDLVWQASFEAPAGNREYKTSLNGTWDLNFGANATQNGADIPLSLAAAKPVKFYYSNQTHWVTDDHNSPNAHPSLRFDKRLL